MHGRRDSFTRQKILAKKSLRWFNRIFSDQNSVTPQTGLDGRRLSTVDEPYSRHAAEMSQKAANRLNPHVPDVDTLKTERPAATCRITASVIMNRLLPHIAKSLALLAVVMLPVEQMLAANCCCRGGQSAVTHVEAGGQSSCCSQVQASCCSTASRSSNDCCGQSQSDSGTKPCRCPAGTCGKDTPNAVEPAVDISSVNDEFSVAAVLEASSADVVDLQTDSAGRTSSEISTSGSQRCVLLCRYRL